MIPQASPCSSCPCCTSATATFPLPNEEKTESKYISEMAQASLISSSLKRKRETVKQFKKLNQSGVLGEIVCNARIGNFTACSRDRRSHGVLLAPSCSRTPALSVGPARVGPCLRRGRRLPRAAPTRSIPSPQHPFPAASRPHSILFLQHPEHTASRSHSIPIPQHPDDTASRAAASRPHSAASRLQSWPRSISIPAIQLWHRLSDSCPGKLQPRLKVFTSETPSASFLFAWLDFPMESCGFRQRGSQGCDLSGLDCGGVLQKQPKCGYF